MKKEILDNVLSMHKKYLKGMDDGVCADLKNADLRNADLTNANLRGADLNGADLRGADLDCSCLPLRCGSLDLIVDRRIAAQIAYHFCRLKCDDPDFIAARNAIVDFANTFHRAAEYGRCEIEQRV